MAWAENSKQQRCSCSKLEALPLEILIKVACCVSHEDLKQLIGVSKIIQDAAIIAKELHFNRTPSEKMSLDSDEAPHAPKQLRRTNWPGTSRNMPRVALFHGCKFTKGYEM